MPPERYTPTQTARHAGISPNTVRMWSREYAEFLSESARPPAGVDRSFTSGDVAVMQAVAQLRANGLSIADVKERLRQQPPEALQDVPEAPKDATIAPGDVPAPLAVQNDHDPAHDAIQTFLERTNVRDQLTDIDRRLERVESQRHLVVVAAAAFAAGAVVVAVVVWLLSMIR